MRHFAIWLIAGVSIGLPVVAQDGQGISRSELKTWLSGPGLDFGKKIAETELKQRKQLRDQLKRANVNKRLTSVSQVAKGRTTVYAFPSQEEKDAALKETDEQIEQLESFVRDPLPGFPRIKAETMQTGFIGVLGRGEPFQEAYRVQQVVDKSNVIIELLNGPKSMRSIWWTRPTEGMVDDGLRNTDGELIEVVGTKQYTTVIGGTRTIKHMVTKTLAELVSSVEK